VLIVSDVVEEVSPALASFIQAIKPLDALVPMVTVRGVGEDVTDDVLKVPNASEVPLKVKLNVAVTVAETEIWSSDITATA